MVAVELDSLVVIGIMGLHRPQRAMRSDVKSPADRMMVPSRAQQNGACCQRLVVFCPIPSHLLLQSMLSFRPAVPCVEQVLAHHSSPGVSLMHWTDRSLLILGVLLALAVAVVIAYAMDSEPPWTQPHTPQPSLVATPTELASSPVATTVATPLPTLGPADRC